MHLFLSRQQSQVDPNSLNWISTDMDAFAADASTTPAMKGFTILRGRQIPILNWDITFP